ncbi:MAG: PAS domain-containing protein [Proteobacteria bacterium]|nr:PAS domain-containing protein [Pseudomonadota bacterium]
MEWYAKNILKKDNSKTKREFIEELSGANNSVAEAEKLKEPIVKNNIIQIQNRKNDSLNLNQANFLEAITDNIPGLIWAKGLNGKLLFANKEMYDTFLKYKNQENITSKTDLHFSPNRGETRHYYDFIKAHSNDNAVVKKTSEQFKFNDIRYVNGSRILEVYKSPLHDNVGNIIGTVGYSKDITENMQAEEALHKYEFMANASNDFMTLINTDYVYEAINDAYCKKWNKKREDIINYKVEDIWGSETFKKNIKPKLDQCFSGKKVYYEESFAFHNNEIRSFEVTYYPYFDNNGNITHVAVITHDISERKKVEVKLKQSLDMLQNMMDCTIHALASTIERRDPYTAGHQHRVTSLACAIAKEMRLDEDRARSVYIASMLHDIGKIQVPSDILSKPGKISIHEFNIIKEHPQIAYDILKEIVFEHPVADIVLQHHERIDGSGYPKGLKGDEIAIEAKIIAVSDVVESMASHRPYRPALGIDKALEEVTTNSGILYDADVVEACVRLFNGKDFKFN